MDEMQLRRCTKELPRPVIAVDRDKYRQDTLSEGYNRPKKVLKTQKKSEVHNADTASPESQRKLRPASDVLNRLRYDQTLNIDDWIVGYEDRHTAKAQEKPARDWVSDTTHEEWIPEHRIVYFNMRMLNGELRMWDKARRIDRIFNKSGVID